MTIDTMTGLTKEEVVRYSRQLILPEFEVEGIKRTIFL